LGGWLGALDHLDADGGLGGEVPCVLAQLLDIEGIAGGPFERCGDRSLLDVDALGLGRLDEGGGGVGG
jgi:hypothetical protein